MPISIHIFTFLDYISPSAFDSELKMHTPCDWRKLLPLSIILWKLPSFNRPINVTPISSGPPNVGPPLHLHNYKSYYVFQKPSLPYRQFNFIFMFHVPCQCAKFRFSSFFSAENMATIEKSNQRAKTLTTIILYFTKVGGCWAAVGDGRGPRRTDSARGDECEVCMLFD